MWRPPRNPGPLATFLGFGLVLFAALGFGWGMRQVTGQLHTTQATVSRLDADYRQAATAAQQLEGQVRGLGASPVASAPPVSGPPGAPGATGATGVQGPVGPMGPQGLPGAPGAAGVAGPQGLAGLMGIPGAAGQNGTPGTTGPAGPQGLPGEPGATGATGPAGANGRGIASVACAGNPTDSFTVTYSDGTTQTFTCTIPTPTPSASPSP
jgi:hypothetical protein